MSLGRSQWLALAGGTALIVAPFLPLVDDGVTVLSLLGANSGMRHVTNGGMPPDILTKLRVLGVVSVIYGAAVVVVSNWLATARHALLTSIAGMLVTIFGSVFVSAESSPAYGWIIFFVGHALVLVAALIDRQQYHTFVLRRTASDTAD